MTDPIEDFVNTTFEAALPTFLDILRIPSSSKNYDPEYLTNGLLR